MAFREIIESQWLINASRKPDCPDSSFHVHSPALRLISGRSKAAALLAGEEAVKKSNHHLLSSCVYLFLVNDPAGLSRVRTLRKRR